MRIESLGLNGCVMKKYENGICLFTVRIRPSSAAPKERCCSLSTGLVNQNWLTGGISYKMDKMMLPKLKLVYIDGEESLNDDKNSEELRFTRFYWYLDKFVRL
ncbi:hypothetical protein TNIN_355331 [Trichonephila inaurata madagascariensis]|uniref:Uncharacterized protein n=1 Tax=Trichonephila inaurata madagascariensis TaxID=2747483 RepID=A0A8X6XS50_9ARAC|nr:hypothetical protein TNIN_355331 [Trichonephila inaurata madagascariensis]